MVKLANIDFKKVSKITPKKNKIQFEIIGRKRPISIKKSQKKLLKKMAKSLILKKRVKRQSRKEMRTQFNKKPKKVIGHVEKGDNMFIIYINKNNEVIKTKLNWERDEKIIDKVLKKKLIKRRIITPIVKKKISKVIKSPSKTLLNISNRRATSIFNYILGNLKLGSKLIYNIRYDNKHYTINDKTVKTIKEVMEKGVRILTELNGSDADMLEMIYKSNKIEFYSNERHEKRKKQDPGFFKYNTKDLHMKEWERYGIYNKINQEDSEMNCLVKSIYEHGNVSGEVIESLKLKCINMRIPFKDVKKIAEQYKLYIEIKYIKDLETTSRIKKAGKKSYKKHFKIGCIDDHYFVLDKKTNITSFAINNFDDIKDLENFNKINRKRNGKYYRANKKEITSFNLIRQLLLNKERLLKPLTWSDINLKSTHFYNKFDKIENLKFLVGDIKKHKKKDWTSDKHDLSTRKKLFFDVETITKSNHIVHTICWYDSQLKKHYGITGTQEDCLRKFLDFLKGGELLLAHNLGYEFTFLFKYLFNISYIKKGNKIMSAKGSYKKRNGDVINLFFKDTYCLIPKALAKFPKMFDLKGIKKEIMPYNLFTEENVVKPYVKIDEALKYVKKEDHKEFIKNIDEWELRVNKDCFNHMEYSKLYCQMDCFITAQGYYTFNQWVNDLCTSANNKFYKGRKKGMKYINVDNVVSAATLAFKFFDHTDCYKGCFKLAGKPREFIQKCVVGGRTMTRDNKKWKVKAILDDLDACSLYPASISRLPGFLKGKPKIINNKNYNNIKHHDGYFVEVEILNCPKKLHFPLLNNKNEDGIRNFSNNIRGKIYVDKIGLEDLIKFHKMEPERDFKIIKGYYFNEGRNKRASKIIKFLYNERLKLKAQGNPAQEIYKLIMNSSYGKTIMKPIDDETHIYENARADIFISRNHNKVKEIILAGNKKIIKLHKSISDHFSYPHIGSEILSMSKRIMNEVICLAEDLKIKIFYQDTDSMHIEQNKVKFLASEYYKIYKRSLIGKKLGQFHGDFDFECDKGHSPVAVESWFLGKKMYLDKIKCVNNGQINYKYHARLKGIPSYCIKNKEEIYNNLLDPKYVHNFEICNIADELNKPLFEFTKDFKIFKNMKLKRKVRAPKRCHYVTIK